MANIDVLYFASLLERLGVDREKLELPHDVRDLSGLLALLRARGGVWRDVFDGDQPVLMALNQEMAKPHAALAEGDEVGLFPPVTGG